VGPVVVVKVKVAIQVLPLSQVLLVGDEITDTKLRERVAFPFHGCERLLCGGLLDKPYPWRSPFPVAQAWAALRYGNFDVGPIIE